MCYPGHEGSAEACQNGIGEEVWGAGSQPKVVDTLFRSMGSGHANHLKTQSSRPKNRCFQGQYPPF